MAKRKGYGPEMSKRKINYSVVSTIERISSLLPETLDSLLSAGFTSPTVYLDGAPCSKQCDGFLMGSHWEHRPIVVPRYPKIGPTGNWVLALSEMYLRDSRADFYLLFEDDIIVSPGLKKFLENCDIPRGNLYLNLYTAPGNESMVPKGTDGERIQGWHKSNQSGKGALGLLIPDTFVKKLVFSDQMCYRLMVHGLKRTTGIDGIISRTARLAGFTEYIHYPSLCQHVGIETTQGNGWKRPSECFYEELDVGEYIP